MDEDHEMEAQGIEDHGIVEVSSPEWRIRWILAKKLTLLINVFQGERLVSNDSASESGEDTTYIHKSGIFHIRITGTEPGQIICESIK